MAKKKKKVSRKSTKKKVQGGVFPAGKRTKESKLQLRPWGNTRTDKFSQILEAVSKLQSSGDALEVPVPAGVEAQAFRNALRTRITRKLPELSDLVKTRVLEGETAVAVIRK